MKEALPNVEVGASMKMPLYLEGGHYKRKAHAKIELRLSSIKGPTL